MVRICYLAALLCALFASGCQRSQLSDLDLAAADNSIDEPLMVRSQQEQDRWIDDLLAGTNSAEVTDANAPITESASNSPEPEASKPVDSVSDQNTSVPDAEPFFSEPPQRPTQTTRPTQTPQSNPVRLRAGVALPQTGPEGILMAFSVDYEFVNGQPNTSSTYRWVIKGTGQRGGALNVKLQRSGNLAVLLNGWRPGEGPYQSWLEEAPVSGDPRRISDIEQMR